MDRLKEASFELSLSKDYDLHSSMDRLKVVANEETGNCIFTFTFQYG